MHPSHQQLLKLVQVERQTTAQILMHLKIINEQKIFVKMQYKSLVDYCVKALGYSESAAYRRVQALRLETKVDVVREKIAKGELNLSKASKLNQLIDLKEKQERKKVGEKEKLQLLEAIKTQSSTEAEETIRKQLQLPPAKRKLTIEMSEESYQKWVEYKGKHVAKRLTDEMLFLFMMEQAEKEKTVRQYARIRKCHRPLPDRMVYNSGNPRFISAPIRRQLFKMANNKCQHLGCQSTYALEIDHKIPLAQGGGNQIGNLQILCRHHNAAKNYGS